MSDINRQLKDDLEQLKQLKRLKQLQNSKAQMDRKKVLNVVSSSSGKSFWMLFPNILIFTHKNQLKKMLLNLPR